MSIAVVVQRPPRAPIWPFWAAAGTAVAAWLVLRPLMHAGLFADAQGPWAVFKAACIAPVPADKAQPMVAALLGLTLLPLAVGAAQHWLRRRAWLADRRDHPVPAVAGRAGREEGLGWRIAGSYGLHVGVILLMLLAARGCAQRLGPPGGGGGAVSQASAEPEEVQEVKVQQVRRRKLIVNPNSAIILRQPDEVQIDLREETRHEAKAQRLGGAGSGPGAGYEGGQGAKLRFVVVNHGGKGWDDADAVAAPNLLREIRARIGVPTALKPDDVSVADLAAQTDPDQQPSVLYLCLGAAAPSFSAADHEFLRRYAMDIGGLLLLDDTGGGRRFAEELARRAFPGLPFVALPQDDRLFNIRENMSGISAEQRALARHGGDRIMGVSDGKRWLMIYHPGDLVDGWRGAYGQRWQETAYRFGVNVFHYATVNFTRIRATEREKKRNAP